MRRRGFLTALLAACAEQQASGLKPQASVEPPKPPPPPAPPPPPDAGVEQLFSGAPPADDPLELLYSRRLSFDEGQPLITVRVAEGRQEIAIEPRGSLTVLARTAKGETEAAVDKGAPGRWTLRLLDSAPGVGAAWVELEQIEFDNKPAMQKAREEWVAKGVPVRVATVGEAYGIAGHVVDTRRYAILAEGDATEAGARRQLQEIESRFGVRAQIHRELASRPSGRIELRDPSAKPAALGFSALELRAEKGITVDAVEFGMGYSFHGFEDRTYPGRLFATVDAAGGLALVAALPMERLVKGVVPSEIFAHAHSEALKAQAATARGARSTRAPPPRTPPPTRQSTRLAARPCSRQPRAGAGWSIPSTRRCAADSPRTTTPSGAGRRIHRCAAGPISTPRRREWRRSPTASATPSSRASCA